MPTILSPFKPAFLSQLLSYDYPMTENPGFAPRSLRPAGAGLGEVAQPE